MDILIAFSRVDYEIMICCLRITGFECICQSRRQLFKTSDIYIKLIPAIYKATPKCEKTDINLIDVY